MARTKQIKGEKIFHTKFAAIIDSVGVKQADIIRMLETIRKEKIAALVAQGKRPIVADAMTPPVIQKCTLSRLSSGKVTELYVATYKRILEALNRLVPSYGFTLDDIV